MNTPFKLEYKYLVTRDWGSPTWESCENKIIEFAIDDPNKTYHATRYDTWNQEAPQSIEILSFPIVKKFEYLLNNNLKLHREVIPKNLPSRKSASVLESENNSLQTKIEEIQRTRQSKLHRNFYVFFSNIQKSAMMKSTG